MHVFIHIPKTGGTTLEHILKQQYGQDELYALRPRKGVVLNSFLTLSPSEMNSIKVLKGHLTFGVHEKIRDIANIKYFSMIRKPENRLVSLYRHIQRDIKHPQHHKFKGFTFSEFLNNPYSTRYQNHQIFQLTATKPNNKNFKNLLVMIEEHYSFVGVQEKYNASLQRLSTIMKWNQPFEIIKRNVSTENTYNLNTDERKLIRRENQFDYKLYDYVCQKYLS